MNRTITIATRGSDLALWQAHHVRACLQSVRPTAEIELKIIKTTGDIRTDVALSKIGGKALFVKEIEAALLDESADIAVHSMKDVPAELAPGLFMAAISSRENPCDALCTANGRGIDAIPEGGRLGTSSLRRQSQMLARRPDLQVGLLRGNVPTRLSKLDAGEFDAIVLAAAGLIRLGLGNRISRVMSPELCLPAVGQGVLGIETRAGDEELIEWVRQACHDEAEGERIIAERAFLARLGGSCKTPLAAYAIPRGDGQMRIDGLCAAPDGSRMLRAQRVGPPEQGEALGIALAEDLLSQGAQEIIDACVALQ